MVHVEQQEQTGEVTGKVKAVNAEDQTFQLEGSDPLIEVNTTTTFGAGLKFSDLKEGDEVRIVGVLRPDGKFEAREIHRQGGAPQSQE
ncbi:MAG TPA: hypothetical protein DCY80_01570 [Solibacterales bacterium]|nr:hypothetical protein [Bryobacterales bacterium]